VDGPRRPSRRAGRPARHGAARWPAGRRRAARGAPGGHARRCGPAARRCRTPGRRRGNGWRRGACRALRSGTSGFWSRPAPAGRRTGSRGPSTAATAVTGLAAVAVGPCGRWRACRAAGSASSGVMSLNRIPGLGKSGDVADVVGKIHRGSPVALAPGTDKDRDAVPREANHCPRPSAGAAAADAAAPRRVHNCRLARESEGKDLGPGGGGRRRGPPDWPTRTRGAYFRRRGGRSPGRLHAPDVRVERLAQRLAVVGPERLRCAPRARRRGVFPARCTTHVYGLAEADPAVLGLRLYMEQHNGGRRAGVPGGWGWCRRGYVVFERLPAVSGGRADCPARGARC